MNNRWIRLFDSQAIKTNVTQDGDPLQIKDAFVSGDHKVLRVTFAASHAGLITRNNGLYMPAKMRDGIRSWLSPYPKPIQVHHEDTTDPIGRVVHAEYVDTLHRIQPTFQDKIARFDWSLKDFSRGKYPIQDQRKIIYDLQDLGLLEDPEWQGLGYTKLIFDISDQEAIQKFLDGRYLTGSIGVSTNSAVCSVRDCAIDWAEADSPCEHRPGKIVDGKKMFLIAGDLKNEEYSVVNGPADPWAQKLKLEWANQVIDLMPRDSIEPVGIVPELTSADHDVIDIKDSTQEEQMKLRPNSPSIRNMRSDAERDVADIVPEFDSLIDSLGTYLETHALTDQRLPELVKLFDHLHEADLAEIVKMFDGVTDPTQELADKFADAVLDLEWNSFDGDSDEAWEDMLTELPLLRDAKLSTAERKKMASSTFCGPARSFPVPDCAHVVAARRLIGKAKGSAATKSRILSCVARKAKAMGCGMTEDAFRNTDEMHAGTEAHEKKMKQMKSEMEKMEAEMEKMRAKMEAMMKTMMDKTHLASLTVEQLKDLQVTLSTTLTEKGIVDGAAVELETLRNSAAELTRSLDEQKESLKYLRNELKMAYEDVAHAEDKLIQVETERREDLLASARTLTALRDKKAPVDVDLTDLTAKDAISIRNTVTQLTDSLDITKIIDKLDDGMARQPTGSVEPPAGVVTETGQPEKEKITMRQYEERRDALKRSGGSQAANVFDSWVKTHAIIVDGE